MENFKIDKNIPITPISKSNKCYPFDDLQVGDSFFISLTIVNTNTIYTERLSVNNHLLTYNRRNKKSIRLCTRKFHDGLRVWRIE